MNKLFVLGLVTIVIVGCVSGIAVMNSSVQPSITSKELDFVVSGKNDCLRFLNSSVSTVYVPIATSENELWELTINATQMAGGSKAWVDLYTYDGYWDAGTNYTCKSKDVYPILSDVVSANAQVKASELFKQTFESTTIKTLFFIFPPGGQSTFHITLKRIG